MMLTTECNLAVLLDYLKKRIKYTFKKKKQGREQKHENTSYGITKRYAQDGQRDRYRLLF